MLGDAAESNPNLALGPKFLEGKDSIAHDIIAFDHEHGDEIAAAGGYGNWGTSQSLFDGLSASLEGHELPEGAFRINVPQGGSGYEFRLSRYLVDQIRGKGNGGNGLFTDLSFDQPFDINSTPDNLNDDVSLYGGPTALAKLLSASVAGQQIDLTAAAASGDFSSMTAVQDRWAPVMDAITAAPGQAQIEGSAVLDATNRQLKSIAASGLGALPLGEGIKSLDGFSKWVINQGKSGVIDSLLDNVFSTNNVSVAEAEQMTAHQALEITQQTAIYKAIAASGSYGNPPVDPALFLEKHSELASFMDDGVIIPYDEMTERQRAAFQQYVVGPDGLGSQTASVVAHSGDALNTARTEREEALRDE